MSPGNLADAPEAQASVAPGTTPGIDSVAVCHIASGDRWAGAEIQIAGLLKSLHEMAGIQVRAIFLNEGRLAQETRDNHIEVKVIPELENGFFNIYSQAAGFLKNKRIQVVHSHRYKENLLAAMLARACKIPAQVRTQHGLPEPFAGIRGYRHGIIQYFDRLTARFCADRLISVSDDMRNHLLRYLDGRRITVVHNGLDPSRVFSNLTVAGAKKKLGLAENAWVLGTAGRLEPVKRLDLFLESARLLMARHPDSHFIIAGSGSEEERLRRLGQSLGIADHVHFLGERQDVYDVLRAMDIMVLCSDSEGLPTVLLEALFLGVPVVARRVGGIPEVVQNGIHGLLVEEGDPRALARASEALLDDQALRQRLALSAKGVVAEHFTVQRTAEQVAALYRSLCRVS